MRDTTGVGSLPHRDPAEAARLAAACSVPYLPQLPGRHPEEGMVRQWGDGLCGCGPGDEPGGLRAGAPVGPREEAFVAAAAALDLLAGTAPPLVKTQATGPITLAVALRAAGHGGSALWECVVGGLTSRIAGHLAEIHRRLPGSQTLVVIDEPALTAVTPGDRSAAAALDALGAVIAAVSGADVGVHCCGDTVWGEVAGLGAGWLSMDVGALGPGFAAGVPAVAEAVSAGTRIIWGAVPVESPPLPSTGSLVARVRRVEEALVLAGADLRSLDRAVLSPACGLAGLSPDAAAGVVRRLDEMAEVMA